MIWSLRNILVVLFLDFFVFFCMRRIERDFDFYELRGFGYGVLVFSFVRGELYYLFFGKGFGFK